MLRLVLVSSAVLALAACAPAGSGLSPSATRAAANPCFRPNLVRNFTAPNEQTLYVRTSATEVFQIDATVCRDLPQAVSIALGAAGRNQPPVRRRPGPVTQPDDGAGTVPSARPSPVDDGPDRRPAVARPPLIPPAKTARRRLKFAASRYEMIALPGEGRG